jgi:predicted nucleic acid-binding protein
MEAGRPVFLVLDANVLIDYCAAERSILTMIARHVGQVHVPSVLLEEVEGLDESECERLGLVVVELESELLIAAGKRRSGLSYYDHVCLLAAKQAGWVCVTNDGRLRRECTAENVTIRWGMEPMIELVSAGHLSAPEARRIARAIQECNPRYITALILEEFDRKVAAALKPTRKRP